MDNIQFKDHKHYVDELKSMHAEGSHKHHSEDYAKHAAGHKLHHEHVKAMCGGGYAKGKK
jgi:hypothetical protein